MDQPLGVRLGAEVVGTFLFFFLGFSGIAVSVDIGSATALFVMVILTVATDERAPWKGVMAPFLIGLFIFTAATAVGPASGGSFNPARSLDPVLYNQDWSNVWIYLVGPLAGGIIGGALWSALVARRPVTA